MQVVFLRDLNEVECTYADNHLVREAASHCIALQMESSLSLPRPCTVCKWLHGLIGPPNRRELHLIQINL